MNPPGEALGSARWVWCGAAAACKPWCSLLDVPWEQERAGRVILGAVGNVCASLAWTGREGRCFPEGFSPQSLWNEVAGACVGVPVVGRAPAKADLLPLMPFWFT